jgi:hypothetical protein
LALIFAKSKRPSEVVQESLSTLHQHSHNAGVLGHWKMWPWLQCKHDFSCLKLKKHKRYLKRITEYLICCSSSSKGLLPLSYKELFAEFTSPTIVLRLLALCLEYILGFALLFIMIIYVTKSVDL